MAREVNLGSVVGPPGPKGDINLTTKLTFEKATEKENIKSGDTFGTVLGKIEKILEVHDKNVEDIKKVSENILSTE